MGVRTVLSRSFWLKSTTKLRNKLVTWNILTNFTQNIIEKSSQASHFTMKKLFLLDAYALIYRAYYAFIKTPRLNSRGENTSAVLGFVNTLEEVLRNENPDYIGVAFDPKGGTFRHEVYPEYKAQREETPEGIRFAVPYIKRILEAYRIPVIEVPGFEADDVIGTLAWRFSSDEIDVFMMTPDKDYGQLLRPHVWMYRPHSGDKNFEVIGEVRH